MRMRAEVASRAPHARKHGTTFAETWRSADGVVRYAWHGLSVDDGGDPVDVLPSYLAKLGIR